jgi:hypothetical protein
MKNEIVTAAPVTRRQFIANSTKAAAAATLAGALPRAGYTAEDNTIKIVLVGCGGRGTGAAAQALSAPGPTKLWAMADFFDSRLQSSLAALKHEKQDKPEQIDVPPSAWTPSKRRWTRRTREALFCWRRRPRSGPFTLTTPFPKTCTFSWRNPSPWTDLESGASLKAEWRRGERT